MNLGLYSRETLQSGDAKMVGDAVTQQFQRSHGALTAWQEVEHTDDGHHTDIHATSVTIAPGGLTVNGQIHSAEGGIAVEGGNVALGDLPIEGTPGQSGGYGVKIDPWRIIADTLNSPSTPAFPGLIFQYLRETAGNFLFRFIRLSPLAWVLEPATGVALQLGRAPNRLNYVDTQGCQSLLGYNERGRALPLGEWASYPVTWSGATIGNGTLRGRTTVIGTTRHFLITLVIGSTTVVPVGTWFFSLPATIANLIGEVPGPGGTALGLDAGVVNVPALTYYVTPTVCAVLRVSDGATFTNLVPFAWGVNDTLTIRGSYEQP